MTHYSNVRLRVINKVALPFTQWLKGLSGISDDRKTLLLDAVGGLLIDAVDTTIDLVKTESDK